MKKVGAVVGVLVGLYFVVRAAVEPFVINMADPATYQDGWGGPSLVGVLLVHMGPGLLCAILIALALVMWIKKGSQRPHRQTDP